MGPPLNIGFSFGRRFSTSGLSAVTLVVLASNSSAFGGAIHDAAVLGDLEKIKALLKDDPALISSRDNAGNGLAHSSFERSQGRGGIASGE
jgi:hypothetical protein